MLMSTMVSSAGEISPAPHEVIYSPVPHSNASTPPSIMSCEYNPAYGQMPPDCTYYGPGPESYQYCPDSFPPPHMCAVNTEYGPITVPLVSSSSSPPIPLPMQVPPGHVVQQIVDENGTLRHMIVSHQPPLLPIPTFGHGNQTQQFYPPGPGYPNPHYNAMQGGSMPCGMPPVSSSSSQSNNGMQQSGSSAYNGPLPAHAQKDERAQRQYAKLRRKLEQKQQQQSREGNSLSAPSYNQSHHNHHQNGTFKKETAFGNTSVNNNNNNGTRRTGTNGTSKSTGAPGAEEDGSVGSTGSVTSTGTQDEEEEHRILAQTEMLSTLHPPVVTDVTSRSALVQWSPPDRISESGENKFPDIDVSDDDFRFEVFINDKTREGRFRSIFIDAGLSCRIKDLSPGCMYAVTFCAMLGDIKGNNSPPTNFSTLPAEPEAPAGPRAMSKTRTSIQLRWNAPSSDNGSKVTAYVLEYDEGKGGSHFVETYRGKNKQCMVSKLQPAFSYQFRLAAVNQCGQSRWSSVVTLMTAGSPPTQPPPPSLAEVGVTFLRLEWLSRPSDYEYALQMEDPSSGHGFISAYNGTAPNYLCVGLRPNFQYKFRLRAKNDEGHSKWSDEVVLSTLPGPPGRPSKPALKGKTHSHQFKVRWDAPSDNGGGTIQAYILEIDQGNGGFEEIYRGAECEYLVDRLSPGQSYALRAMVIGSGGVSEPSESCVITTEPVCPGKCHIPRVVGKPKSNSVHLKWNAPDYDGGSPVNQYEVGCTTPDNQTQEAYRGKETECTINRLLPGRAYLFQIRAFNRIGAGPWSDPLEVVSGAGSPDAPAAPKLTTKTSHMVLVSWSEPLNNGSAVTEYRVQMASPAPIIVSTPSPVPTTPTPSVDEGEEGAEQQHMSSASSTCSASETQVMNSQPQQQVSSTPLPLQPRLSNSFSQVYLGNGLSCEVKGLQPASIYLFRVQAINGAGSSEWSPVTTHQMPATSPNAVTNVDASPSSNEVSLRWVVPNSNGSPILHYNVMVGETVLVAPTNSFVVENLSPDTHYKIRVQAVNSIGPGAFSSVVKVTTKPLPPAPPKLECVSTTHFWMKLKWSDASNKSIEYLVQMINPYKDEFEVVYRGINPNCKVNRLTEDTEYHFRICAINSAGQGPFSDMYRFCTLKAPPSPVKEFKVERMTDVENLQRFEWLPVCCDDSVEYQMQMCRKKGHEFKVIYRGKETTFELKEEDLDIGVDYTARVCAIRLCDDGTQLVGPYSSQVFFRVPSPQRDEVISSKNHSSFSSKSLSTTAQVSSTFIHAIEEKLQNISYESRIGIIAVIALIFVAFLISFVTHHVVS